MKNKAKETVRLSTLLSGQNLISKTNKNVSSKYSDDQLRLSEIEFNKTTKKISKWARKEH